MPTKVLEAWAKESGKSLDEVEKAWNSCKSQAKKKFGKEDEHYWAYVNSCTRRKIGLEKNKPKVPKGKKPKIHDW